MDGDRELLEKAARAGGYEVARWTDDGTALLLVGIQKPWNALHENPHSDCMGDALRLMATLNINVFYRENINGAFVIAEHPDIHFCPESLDGPHEWDATRRAIVRAAAAMAPAKESEHG